MKVLSKVLWAVDMNEDHSKSMDKVLNTAGQFGSEILLLHVLHKNIETSSFRVTVEKALGSELDNLAKVLRENGEYNIKTRISYGNVAEKILDVAEDEDVNIIFMNRGAVAESTGTNLGLNAQKVVSLSQKPVAIISNIPTLEDQHIICPVDFSEPSTLALNSAILHARKFNAKLTLISVFEPIRITSSRLLNAGLDERTENEIRLISFRTELEEYLAKFNFEGVEVQHEVLSGNPFREIIRYSRLASTMYLGSTGKSGLRRAILGSVTEKVIREVECNAVVVKSEELFKLRIPADLENIEKHFDRGNELTKLGFYKEAISQYNLCMRINDLHLPSIWALAALYEKLEDKERQIYFEDLARVITRKMTDRKIEAEIRRNLRSAG